MPRTIDENGPISAYDPTVSECRTLLSMRTA